MPCKVGAAKESDLSNLRRLIRTEFPFKCASKKESRQRTTPDVGLERAATLTPPNARCLVVDTPS